MVKINTITTMAQNHNDKNVLILWAKITKLAQQDVQYAEALNIWLKREKSTVHFRDEVALPFKGDKEFEGHLSWDNAWIAIDNFSSVLYREEKVNLITNTHILTISKGGYLDILQSSSKYDLAAKTAIGNYPHSLLISDGRVYYDEVALKQNTPFDAIDMNVTSHIKERIADYLMDNEDCESLYLFIGSIDKYERQSLIDDFYDASSIPAVGTVNKIKESIVQHFSKYSEDELVYEYEKYLAERLEA